MTITIGFVGEFLFKKETIEIMLIDRHYSNSFSDIILFIFSK
jgi:hypothetical protein